MAHRTRTLNDRDSIDRVVIFKLKRYSCMVPGLAVDELAKISSQNLLQNAARIPRYSCIDSPRYNPTHYNKITLSSAGRGLNSTSQACRWNTVAIFLITIHSLFKLN